MSDSNKPSYPAAEADRNYLLAMISGDMFKGFLIGGVAAGAVGGFILVLYLIGMLLPPESKEAPDPSYGFKLEAPSDPAKTRIV